MAFFVVERSAVDSSLRIPLPGEFSTREAAIAALSAATASGSVTLAGEVFISDLNASVPVLVMQAATPVAPAQSEVAGQADEPAVDMDHAAAEDVYSSWESIEESPLAGGPSLADALKRAATSLEGEGIVAPDSIEPERASDLGEAEQTEALAEDVPTEEAPAEFAAVAEPASISHESADVDKDAQWPWANVQSYEIPEATSPELAEEESETDTIEAPLTDAPNDDSAPADVEEVAAMADVQDAGAEALPDLAAELSALGLGGSEPVAEEADIITGAPSEGEDAYMPRPVILGDYADAEGETISAAGDETVELTVAGEDFAEPAAAGDDSDVGAAAHDEDSDLEYVVQVLVEEEVGYAATGELDLAEYACTDCVYSNTCPKVGQATPADCGSFQWRSE